MMESQRNPKEYDENRLPFWQFLLRLLGVTFICLFSVMLGAAALILVPQASDLLYDVRLQWQQAALYWTIFFFSVLLFWAYPVQFCARLLVFQKLHFLHITPQCEWRFEFAVKHLPRILKGFVFASVAFAIYLSFINIPYSGVPQDDMTIYVRRHIAILLIFAVLSVVFFGAIDWLLLGNFKWMQRIEKHFPNPFRWVKRRWEMLCVSDLANAGYTKEKLEWERFSSTATFFYMLCSIFVVTLIIVFHFLSYSLPGILSVFKRATFFPLALGAWIPFVALLAMLSYKSRWPIILILTASVFLAGFLFGDGHTIRILFYPAIEGVAVPASKALTLRDAIKLWQCKNSCGPVDACPGTAGTNAQGKWRKQCPRPIIVALEGGASRSAFFASSVVAQLDALASDIHKASGRGDEPFPLRNQIFAISSVSGGSLAAAAIASSWKYETDRSAEKKDMLEHFDERYLSDHSETPQLWYKYIEGHATPEKFVGNKRKALLQIALSDDFLSPAITALYARDLLGISRIGLEGAFDRAAALEMAWETSFAKTYKREGSPGVFEDGFAAFAPDNMTWRPILIFNTTSVETGRRVLITPLINVDEFIIDASLSEKETEWGTHKRKGIFTDVYNLYDILCSEKNPGRLDGMSRTRLRNGRLVSM
jgi:hypothetical protein